MPRRSCCAHDAGHQALFFEPADDPRQGALAEVNDVRQRLHPTLAVGLAGQFVEDLELADPEPVLAERLLQRAGHPRVLFEERAPVAY